MAVIDRHKEDLPMATTAENVTSQYRHPWIAVQFSIGYKMQLARSRLSGDENLSPRIDERHLLHSVVFLRFYRLRLVTLGSMLQNYIQ